jgi:hypothetical protein
MSGALRRVGVAAVATLALSAGPAAAAPRYAHPDSGKFLGDCPQSDPCRIDHAIEGAASGDEVIVLPGEYTVDTRLDVVDKRLDIHGLEGQPRPRIRGGGGTAGDTPMLLVLDGAPGGPTQLRHLHLTGDNAAFTVWIPEGPAALTGLVVDTTTSHGHPIEISGGSEVVVRDTVAYTPFDTSTAIGASGRDIELRNVTAIGGGQGLRVRGYCVPRGPLDPGSGPCRPGSAPGVVTARNVIARGGSSDLRPYNPSYAPMPGVIRMGHSNYRTVVADGEGATVVDEGHNQTAEPLLADPAGGDFHQLPASPTIDAGAVDPLLGQVDLDGESRFMGAAPDIGADELFTTAGGGPPDGEGGGPGGGGGPPGGRPDETAPLMQLLRVSPRAIRRRATVTYVLSEDAAVRMTVARRRSGRRVGGRCRAVTPRNAERARCKRWKRARGALTDAGEKGGNAIVFDGRMRGRRLRTGAYRLKAVATDAAGNRSPAARTRFRIAR